jgi:hypothetical protein
MTDDNGTVQFPQFIQAGMKAEPFTYIHVKVRAFEGSNETLEWTSQFYLNNSINELVHTQPPVSHIKDVFRCFDNLTVAIRFSLLS